MIIREVVVKDNVSEEELLLSSKIGVVKNVQDTARLIRALGSEAPLEMFGLRHLKRVRKVTSPDRVGGAEVQIYICPSSGIADISEEILKYFKDPLLTLDVCRVKPRDRADRDSFGTFWPVVFRPTELSEEQEKGLSRAVEDAMIAHLTSLQQRAINCTHNVESASSSPPAGSIGALIVNPANNKVVIDASEAWQFLVQKQESCGQSAASLTTHPLYTPVMTCIEGVAAIVRGDIPCTNSSIQVMSDTPHTDQYVCTGLDAYMLTEPNVMEAMALVHSRIRRVIYLHPDPARGALGSVFSLHGIASLNHRFRVFQGIESSSTEENVERPIANISDSEARKHS